jgi:hypothetical protein
VEAEVGQFIGTFLAVVIVPVLLMIVLKLIPGTKRNTQLVYMLPGTLAVLISFVPANTSFSTKVLLAILMANLFFWGYRRAIRKAEVAR